MAQAMTRSPMGRTTAHGRPPQVLLLLPNWLGDVIMSTPLISFLTQAFTEIPAADRPTLHLAVRRRWAPLFAADPRARIALNLERTGRHRGLTGIWRQAAEMKHGQFDAVLLGPPSLRAGLAAALSGIPIRLGHATDGRGLLLKPGLARGPRGSRHYSFEMLDLGLALLEILEIPAPPLPAEGLPLAELPGCVTPVSSRHPTAGPGPLWVVAPGTTYGEAKTWPLDRMREFVELAGGEAGARVVLLGDGTTADFVGAMRQTSRLKWSHDLATPGEVVDLTGRTDLAQVVEVMQGASAFVGNDSGLMHLAGALGLPTVGIFGSSNPDWTHPLGEHTTAVVASGFSCRPCYRKTCNQSRFCLEEVTAAAVLSRVQKLVAAVAPKEGN